jgi:hypothetical protein
MVALQADRKSFSFDVKPSAKSTSLLFFVSAAGVRTPEKMAKGAKSMMQPINLIFRFLNHKSRVCIWLVEQNQVRCAVPPCFPRLMCPCNHAIMLSCYSASYFYPRVALRMLIIFLPPLICL